MNIYNFFPNNFLRVRIGAEERGYPPNLTRDVRPYAFIENVVTNEEYCGKGYATECLNYAKEIAIKNNCYKMMLLTGTKKESTLNFYKNAGYNSEDKTAFIQWLE